MLYKNGQQAGTSTTLTMTESTFFERISAYMAENESKAALEAEINESTVKTNEVSGGGCEMLTHQRIGDGSKVGCHL